MLGSLSSHAGMSDETEHHVSYGSNRKKHQRRYTYIHTHMVNTCFFKHKKGK